MTSPALTDVHFTPTEPSAYPPAQLAILPRATTKRLDRVSGRALECLAHAIEYLEDSTPFSYDSTPRSVAVDQAVQLLKSLNRSVFAELPNAPVRTDPIALFFRRLRFGN